MPSSNTGLTQSELDTRAAYVATIDEAYLKLGKGAFVWPRSERGSGEAGAEAAAAKRDAIIVKFAASCVVGGPGERHVRVFNRHLKAIQDTRKAKAAASADSSGGETDVDDLFASANH